MTLRVSRLTALGLAFFLVSAVWCGGFAALPPMTAGMENPHAASECGQPLATQNSTTPCVFRSFKFLSQIPHPVFQEQGIFHGDFIPAIAVDLSRQILFKAYLSASSQGLSHKTSPSALYSVLNL